MKARLVFRYERVIGEDEVLHVVAWDVPVPVLGSAHSYKYSFAYVRDEVCVVRYDNERGKGDHRHLGDEETAYDFIDLERLERDFLRDVREWRVRHGGVHREGR